MDLYIPGHDPSTIDGSPRNQRGTAPSNRSRDNSHRDVYDEVYGGGVQNAPAAPPRGWRTTTATPTSLGKAFTRDQEVKVQEPGTGKLLDALVVRDTNADDKTVLVTINGKQSRILNDPAFIN